MKKLIKLLVATLVLLPMCLQGQDKLMCLYRNGEVIYQREVSYIDSILFETVGVAKYFSVYLIFPL